MSSNEILGLGIVGLVMLAGLIGTLVPGIPGAPLILVAGVGHKMYFGQASITYFALSLMVVFTILSVLLDFLGSLLGAKKLGATWRGMLGAVIGAVVGLFFSLPGLILGPILGAFLFEFLGGRAWRESAKAGVGALVGMILGGIGRIACCVIMITIFVVSLFWNNGPVKAPATPPAMAVLGVSSAAC